MSGRRQPWRLALALPLLLLGGVLGLGAPAHAEPAPTALAADHFGRGERLYGEGRYEEAVAAFLAAQRLAPHRATLFNIARCYENSGDLARALRYYRDALAVTQEPAKRDDIERRMARINRRELGVLVTTEPPGASLNIDGRAGAEAQVTPVLVKLAPGPHLLLLRRAGFQPAVARVEVAVGQQHKVAVALERAAVQAPSPCLPRPRCAAPDRLVDARHLQLHLHLLAAVSLTGDRGLSAGPGVQLHATYHNLVFGGHFLIFATGLRARPEFTLPGGNRYDGEAFRRWIAAGQVGWMQPWRNAYFYGTASMGVLVDRAIFDGPADDFVREKFAFTWGLGGGLEIKAVKWLSFGMALRFGMAHGDRVDDDDPLAEADDTHHFPFGVFWASATFHL